MAIFENMCGDPGPGFTPADLEAKEKLKKESIAHVVRGIRQAISALSNIDHKSPYFPTLVLTNYHISLKALQDAEALLIDEALKLLGGNYD